MKRTIIASLTVFLTAFLIYSCTRVDTTDLGGDLIPAIDNINTFETVLDVISDNRLFNDTTRMLYNEAHAVGVIENDAEFGKTTAALYLSLTPPTYKTYPFTKKDTVFIDSVVLSLAYTETFGDSNSIQQFEVREIEPGAGFVDSLYPLDSPDIPSNTLPIGSASVNFLNLNDSVRYLNVKDTVKTSNELRIPLDTMWARRFVNYTVDDAYKNDTIFKQQFKGLEVKVNEGASPLKNALAYFSLDDAARTRITFYCRVTNNGKADTIAPYFAYTLDPHANIIRRTPANAYLANVTNSTANDERLFIQTTPGSYAYLTVPGIDTLKLTNRVIHRAELIMEKVPSAQEDIYTVPPALFIDQVSAVGDSAFTIRNDFVFSNSDPGYDINTLGGVYRNNKYVFNLTRYLQSTVTKGFPNYALRVYAPFATTPYYIPPNNTQFSGRVGIVLNTPVSKGRVVLYGGGATEPKKMRLRIIYSRI